MEVIFTDFLLSGALSLSLAVPFGFWKRDVFAFLFAYVLGVHAFMWLKLLA